MRLKELRLSNNLKQREVGALVGLDGTFISKIERNEKSLNRSHIKVLAKHFQVNEDELQILWLADKIHKMVEKERFAKASISNVLKRFD